TAGLPPQWVWAPPAVNVGTSIGWVLQDLGHTRAVRWLPNKVVRRGTVKRPYRQKQVAAPQVTHHGLGAAQLAELGEYHAQSLLHLLVRIEGDAAVAIMDQSRRKRQPQFAACRLLAFSLMKADLDLMQFRFAHDPRQAQEKPIVVCRRVIEPFAIGDQHAKQRAQLEELMPISVVTREARRVQAHDQAGLAQTHFCDQGLKALPIPAGRPRFTQIVIDDVNPLAWPTEQSCSLDQAVLQRGALL